MRGRDSAFAHLLLLCLVLHQLQQLLLLLLLRHQLE